MSKKNVIYAQSGGATAVINASACGVIETCRQHPQEIGRVFAAKNGILGVLQENLIDTSEASDAEIAALRHTPGSAFGSCRFKLNQQNDAQYQRLFDVFAAHDIGYFFYNGGGDSQDTAAKVSRLSRSMNYPLTCIGIPKTIDNDLAFTDTCPGYGSVAKYVAISTQEAALDIAGMAATSTKVFILEVMGRHTGWIAAAAGLGKKEANDPPHMILFPEIAFDSKNFLEQVQQSVSKHGYCVIVTSEGIRDKNGDFIRDSDQSDAFGHMQLGGVAPILAKMVKNNLGYKYHWAVSDYLQRAARHIAAKVDVEQAYALGQEAVKAALTGTTDVMLTIERQSNDPYQWNIGQVALSKVANVECKLPNDYISAGGYHITDKCKERLLPLIQGECYPPYKDGLPHYVKLKNKLVQKKLKTEFVL